MRIVYDVKFEKGIDNVILNNKLRITYLNLYIYNALFYLNF